MNEQALQKIEPPEPTTPQALMRRATDVAGVCREIVLKTACEIQGRKFVKVEGWESIATAHGCFVGAEDAERAYDKEGHHIGYKARAVMRNTNGDVIATGEGFVGFDERDRKGNATWKNRAEYAGRAMAQTRSISRVCRSVFAHVVVLIDAGLSTTPAEEVPEGGFEDDNRAAKAKPVTAPAKAPVMASEDQRKRWIALLKPIESAALAYAYERGILNGPEEVAGDLMPGEPIELWPLEATPTTKKMADMILRKIQAKMDPESAGTTEPPSDTGGTAKNASQGQSEANTQALEDGVETMTGTLETISIKEGRSSKGKWTRYGVKVDQTWFSTFDHNLGKLAQQDEGQTVTVFYKPGKRGNELVGLEPAQLS